MTTDMQRLYSSRIIKATALLTDTKTLLTTWDMHTDIKSNLERIRQQNLFGKTSRTRLRDVLTIFRQRYFDDPQVGEMLVFLAQSHAPTKWIDPLLYFFSAQNDQTLRDLVIEVLYPRKQAGYLDIPVIVVQNALLTWIAEGKTTSKWSTETIIRVTRNSLAALRDFGILQGGIQKNISPVYLPVESFALIAFWLMQRMHSGQRVLHSPEWRLFFFDVADVERYFIEAHQEGLLSYFAAGSVVRLEFPATTLQEYANGFVERAR